ncbi:KAP family P-loop NTPase fold protein [Aquitalea pelogenes]|uniref:KAP family P-loop NTPase fold protein n=1 Tax=Aquitalea pelogenes TaxID=1293573 RepID=UPI0035B21E94
MHEIIREISMDVYKKFVAILNKINPMMWGVRLGLWNARRKARAASKIIREQQPDQGIGAESPIRKSSEDKLRRKDFACHIAKILSELSPREGRIFSIRGGWGYGKSSLKNLITEQLDSDNNGADWLDFNPWQWGDGNAIARALFEQMANRLGGDYSESANERAEALRRYGKLLVGGGSGIKKIGSNNHLITMIAANAAVISIGTAVGFKMPAVAKIGIGIAAVSFFLSILGTFLVHVGRDRSNESLDKIRKSLEERLSTLEKPLVVFVDDIDRLEPEQIRTLLRQIKANANLPNIIFVLLFQPSIVESALHPISDGDGRAFLEKIIQANFDLPVVPSAVVHEILAAEIEVVVGLYATKENGFSTSRWGNAFVGCIQPSVRNLRDVRRLISSIEIHFPLHLSGKILEVNLIDFIILECVRVFEPAFHSILSGEKRILLQNDVFRSGNRDFHIAEAEKLLEIIPEARRGYVRNSVNELFPNFKGLFENKSYSDSIHSIWAYDKRVCHDRFFSRYFELNIPSGQISEGQFSFFLNPKATSDELNDLIANIERDGKLRSLAERLDESVGQLPISNSQELLCMLFIIAEKIAGSGVSGGFDSSWICAWRSCHWYIKRIPEAFRDVRVLQVFRLCKVVSISAMLISLSDASENESGEGSGFDPAFSMSAVAELKLEWLRIVNSRDNQINDLLLNNNLTWLLRCWERFSGGVSEPRSWISEIITDDHGFIRVVDCMLNRGRAHAVGDRVSIPYNTFRRVDVEDFIGVDVVKERMAKIIVSDYPEYAEVLENFAKHIDMWGGESER